MRINTRENARLTFEHVASDVLQDMMSVNFKFFKRANDDTEFAKVLFDFLFDRIVRRFEGAA